MLLTPVCGLIKTVMSALRKLELVPMRPYKHVSREEFEKTKVIKPGLELLKRWNWSHAQALNLGADDLTNEHLIGLGVKPEAITTPSPNHPWSITQAISAKSKCEFQPNSFDVVVANMVLHRMSNRRLRATTAHIRDAMKPGAELFFIGPNPEVHSGAKEYLGKKRQLHISLAKWYNPEYIDVLKDMAPNLGMNYIEMPKLLAPKYNPNADAEVEYQKWYVPSERTAGLLINIEHTAKFAATQLELEPLRELGFHPVLIR